MRNLNWRFLKRNKLIHLINLTGLTIGLSVSLLLLMYVKYENNFDGFYQDSKRVFRAIASIIPPQGESWSGSGTPPPLAKEIRASIPEVEKAGRLLSAGTSVFHYEDKFLEENNAYYSEPEILEILDIQLISGDKKNALRTPQTVIISETFRNKLFGNINPVGKTLLRNKQNLEITGVFKDYPKNSHTHPELLMSYTTPNWILKDHDNSWDMFWLATYVKLHNPSSKGPLELKLTKILNANKTPDMAQGKYSIALQAVPDIHLRSTLKSDQITGGNQRIISVLRGIALLILIIAIINLVNTTSVSIIDRSPQVGVKKILGSGYVRLVSEFIWETFIIYLSAIILSICIIITFLPRINGFLDSNLGFHSFSLNEYLTGFGIFIFCILVTTLYPAFIMISLEPAKTLKKKALNSSSGLNIRKTLIGFQYFISFSLIFLTLVIYKQTQLLIKNDLGISTNGIMVIKGDETEWNDFPAQMDAFKNEAQHLPGIVKITRSNALPGIRSYIDEIVAFNQGNTYRLSFNIFDTDEDFVETMGLKLLAGRDFNPDIKNNQGAYILTLKGIKQLGFSSPQEAIGKDIIRSYGNAKARIIGVVNDFKLSNKSPAAYPSAINASEHSSRFIALRFSNTNYADVRDKVKAVWQKNFGTLVFRNFFLNDTYKEVYNKEIFQSKLFSFFSILSIVISALGLFGLTYFTIVKREKEFSIRKVNGARVNDIFNLVFFSFIYLIIIVTAVAIPIMYQAGKYWLTDYEEHVQLQWWFFLMPFVLLGIITLATISYHTIKIALINPVQLLKNE